MSSPVVEAFSLSHAQILDGATDFLTAALASATAPEELDVYGVNEASLSPDADEYVNEGDDVEMSVWNWLNKAELEVQAGYLSFPLIASLTGQTISSAGSGAGQIFGLDLYREDSFNVAPKPGILVMPSRDKKGVVRRLTIGLYKIQFAPIEFDGPQYKEGLKVNYNGKALLSAFDEKGQPFADGVRRVGKLLSHA